LSKDIIPILDGWEFDPDELQVRIVEGIDGRDKIQMRVDLGLFQMELTGRPDGLTPFGYETLLGYHQAKSARNTDSTYRLDAEACAGLMREGMQYYHRYLAAFHLQRYDIVARDTSRNLELFAFVRAYASRERDKVEFDKYRPYVTVMRTRALGLAALEKDDHAGALAAIDLGLDGVRQFLKDYDEPENELECMELAFLLRWRRDVDRERPVSPVQQVEQQLERAVALEDYEEAARLRDQLRRLRGEIPVDQNVSKKSGN
jgi:hypothetical protein